MKFHIEERRGGVLEATHPIFAVLVSPAGHVVEQIGDNPVATWRSAAKPFQLATSLGCLPDLAFSDEELAIGTSSHSGQLTHISRVAALMTRLGVAESDLRCGGHAPVHAGAYETLLAAGDRIRPIHNNCSGKHTFMLAAARALGAPLDSYQATDHPLQVRIRAAVEHVTGGVEGAVVDGCGVPCFVLRLSAMATAWAAVAAQYNEDTALGRIGRAMNAFPELVSGEGRLDLGVVGPATRPVVSKVGAMGLSCLAVPGLGGIALKAATGSADARAVALKAILDRWAPGLLPADALEDWHVVKNVVGRPVGRRTAHFSGTTSTGAVGGT